jgi:hypothetical protein
MSKPKERYFQIRIRLNDQQVNRLADTLMTTISLAKITGIADTDLRAQLVLLLEELNFGAA